MLLTMLPSLVAQDTVLSLGLAGWAGNLLTLGFLAICLVLILIVLIQRPQGGGLSGAFGSGAGSGQTAFGAKTGDALTAATIGIFILFLVAAVGLNFAARPTPAQQAQSEEDTALAESTERELPVDNNDDATDADASAAGDGRSDSSPADEATAEPASPEAEETGEVDDADNGG